MTSTGLADLEEIALTCRTERARTYIQEALAAYRGGAYRAAIVSAWVAVVFDLVDKFRDLALAGDAQAKQVVGSFDGYLAQLDVGDQTAINSALQFERDILDTARTKFQLFDQHQFVDLSRLRDDRNRCAHPTYQREGVTYQPSAELARTHIRHAIEHALRQAPVQGKAAIDSVIGSVASEFFPTKVDDASILLAEGPLGKPSPALVQGTVDRLLSDMFTQGAALYRKPNVIVALKAVIGLHRDKAETRVAHQSRKVAGNIPDEELPILTSLAARVPEVWDGLTQGQQNKVKQYLKSGPIRFVAVLLRDALNAEYLKEVATERIDAMSVDDLALAVSGRVGAAAVPKAVEFFSTARSFDKANAVAEKVVLPLVEHLTANEVKTIVRSPRERGSDLRRSLGLAMFIGAVRQHKVMASDELNALLKEEDLEYLVREDDALTAELG